MSRKIKVIELFSGMGGMHYALSQAKKLSNEAFDFEVVRAIDISDVANQGKKAFRLQFQQNRIIVIHILSQCTSTISRRST